MKKTSVFLAILALSTGALAQNAPSYKFKKPVAQFPVQTSSGGPSNPDSGGGTPPPVLTGQLEVSTNALNFGAVEVGNSSSLSFLVGNFGQAALSLNPVTYLGLGYTADNLCGSSLNVAQDCQVSVSFSPTARGAFNGSATVTSSAGSKTVTFTGQGVQASGSLQPGTSADFGSVVVGQSADRVFLFSNTGDAPARNTQVQAVSAPLSIVSNSCGNVVSPVTLNPGQNCSVSLRYQPTAPTALSSSLTVVSSAENSPVSLTLTGQGTQAQGVLTALSGTDFGSVTVGQTATLNFVFNNTGTAPATGVYASTSGSTAITLVNNQCGTSSNPVTLNPGQECTVSVRYTPLSSETLTGAVLSLHSSAPSSPQTSTLTGSATVSSVGIVETAGVRQYADGSSAANCNSYIRPTQEGKTYTGATGSGMYRIDPDGSGAIAPFNVYCDMTTISPTDGLTGGWTLVVSVGDASIRISDGGHKGSTPLLSQVPGSSINKFADSIIYALNGKLGRMQAVVNGNTANMYWRYSSQSNNPWLLNFKYTSSIGEAGITPQCWSPQNTWVTGRYYHLGDCYNLTTLGTAGAVLTANSAGATYGHSTAVWYGYVWIR